MKGNMYLCLLSLDARFFCVKIKEMTPERDKSRYVDWWETLIRLLQREATQRDVERERRQRMEAEARVREATAEAERARSRVHHLQRELAR